MKVLITGGAGFIGKHLTKFLLDRGCHITIFDNFSNSEKEDVSFLVDMDVKIIEGDITDLQSIVDAVKDHDVVVHLAAKISVPESVKNPDETFHVNVDGTKNLLIACKKNHIKKLIAASSAAVYGKGSENLKLTENSPMNPISPYGESKVRMEEEIRKFILEYKIDSVILRFFNIFGDWQSPEYAGVITKFIKKIKDKESLEIFGDGKQTRDFISVNDVTNSIYCAINDGSVGTYNIASGKAVTINELATLMISLSGEDLSIKYLDSKEGDVRYSQADIILSEKEINFSPKSGLAEIKKLLERDK
jgi:nucleoside-diphosphate-sugar epimerase|tara:strand:- start:109 stop:1023 length:915 start_codon:yes stop_codon:yes gene_type:complete